MRKKNYRVKRQGLDGCPGNQSRDVVEGRDPSLKLWLGLEVAALFDLLSTSLSSQ